MADVDNELSSSWSSEEDQPNKLLKRKPLWRRWRTIIGAGLMLFILALALGVGLSLGRSIGPRGDEPGADIIVDLGYTKYRGKAFNDGTSQWLGMRYAAPPVGQLRFAAPANPLPSKKVEPAVAVSRRALQSLR